MSAKERRTLSLHGHPINYVQEGRGPVLLLVHGMAGELDTWRLVIDSLAQNATALAVDLPGHGSSSSAGGDYSLGSLATFLRDVLIALGHERATLVGHSLGGGIAMQFAYQFPQMTERLVLVSSGGLGVEVSPVLRGASLPGANLFLTLATKPARQASDLASRLLRTARLSPNPGNAELMRSFTSLANATRRQAFLATIRSVVGPNGQTVQAGDRLHLAGEMPVLMVWGAADPIIPVTHAHAAQELLPHASLVVLDGVGHFPQLEAPAKFITALQKFCAETESAVFDAEAWQARMQSTKDKYSV